MDIGNFTEILDSTFHWWSHNSSYATPGVYDLDIKDVTWCLSSALVFFTMKTGLALLEAGIVSRKNEINVMFKHMADICVAGLAYWIFGFALQYGRGEYTNPFFGFGDFIVDAKNNDPLGGQLLTFFFFQMSFATTSTTLVSGAIAERCRFSAYMLYSFLSTIVYSVGAGWIWGQHGFLKNLGALDFAGAAPIHITGGAAALVAVCYIGPRVGRYSNGTGALPMGNPMNVCLGLFILWFSWIAFNAGSSYGITAGRWDLAARAGVGTTLATMSAGTFSMWFSMLRHKGKVDILEVVSGVLASLVAINAGCFVFPTYVSVLVGAVAAFLTLISAPIFDKLHIDDAVGAVSVHLVSGIWGHVAVGLFADPSSGRSGLLMGGGWYLLAVQCFSAICITFWAATATLIIIYIVDKTIPIRLSRDDEIVGCDLAEHNLKQNIVSQQGQPEPLSTINKIISITQPIAQRFSPSSQRHQMRPDAGRRRSYHNNMAYEHENEKPMR